MYRYLDTSSFYIVSFRQETRKKSGGAMSHDITPPVIFMRTNLCVLYLLNDSLESGGVVEGEVGKHLAVDLYA